MRPVISQFTEVLKHTTSLLAEDKAPIHRSAQTYHFPPAEDKSNQFKAKKVPAHNIFPLQEKKIISELVQVSVERVVIVRVGKVKVKIHQKLP